MNNYAFTGEKSPVDIKEMISKLRGNIYG